jgi:hypothetical protein
LRVAKVAFVGWLPVPRPAAPMPTL